MDKFKIQVGAVTEENRRLRQASVNIQARAEQEEEFISNTLLKKIQELKKEKVMFIKCRALDDLLLFTSFFRKRSLSIMKKRKNFSRISWAKNLGIYDKKKSNWRCVEFIIILKVIKNFSIILSSALWNESKSTKSISLCVELSDLSEKQFLSIQVLIRCLSDC